MSDNQGSTPLDYGDPEGELRAAREAAVVVDLSELAVIELHCPEARRWGNGMFTNNIRRLQEGEGNRNAMCDDRGRVLGLLDLYFLTPEHFVLVLDGVDRDWFETHYRMYLILDDVELEPEPEEAARVLSVQGPGAESVLLAMGLELPQGDRGHLSQADGTRVCRRGRSGLDGFDLLVPLQNVESCWERVVEAGARPVGSRALEKLRVVSGEPSWPRDGREKTLIHELGLEGEVCAFDKGCYLGQEVINRVDVKGAIQKRITGVRLHGPSLPPPDGEVILDGKSMGSITSVVEVEDYYIGIGILRKSAWEPGQTISMEAGDATWTGETVSLPHPLP